ncbi:MAG: hypothetical protein II310_07010 [Selenomonadaceae bacterium]|nr:hypothetical protein [Selenomonadaceae bacterium]
MECIVTRAFFDKHSGDGYHAGDVYTAEAARASELQALGYVKLAEPMKLPDENEAVPDSDTQAAAAAVTEKKTAGRKAAK